MADADAPLRILCTEIAPYRLFQQRAERDLGFALRFEQHDFQTAQRLAAMEPERYDIYDQCFHNLDIVWHWRAIQPIELERIRHWADVGDLAKKGRIGVEGGAETRIAPGDAPATRLYVQEDGALGAQETARIAMLPTVHNFDAFGLDMQAAEIDVDREIFSWSELLSPRWRGRAALVDEPAIGPFDLALAARAEGALSFADLGAMRPDEIDALCDYGMELCRAGHFAAFWRSANDLCALFEQGQAVIASMWSPAAVALKARGLRIRQAVPREGYRAWHGGLSLAAHLQGRRLEQAYAYLNWVLDGWFGALMARQGYYMSAPERVRAHLTPEEWAYWYEGEPAARPLPDPSGTLAIQEGEQRSGGSYWRRAAHIAVWNTVMDEHNYLVRRWSALAAAPGDGRGTALRKA